MLLLTTIAIEHALEVTTWDPRFGTRISNWIDGNIDVVTMWHSGIIGLLFDKTDELLEVASMTF